MNKLELTLRGISIAADVLTLLGVGGIVSWSLFSKDRGRFHERVAEISAFALKTALCFVIFTALYGVAWFVLMTVLIVFKGSVSHDLMYWDSTNPLAHIVGYTFVGLSLGTFFVLLCLSVYTWSFEPFSRLKKNWRKTKKQAGFLSK